MSDKTLKKCLEQNKPYNSYLFRELPMKLFFKYYYIIINARSFAATSRLWGSRCISYR